MESNKKYLKPGYLKTVKNILPPFSMIPVQDVNLDGVIGKTDKMNISESLFDAGILSLSQKERLSQIVPMRLTSSIDPHNDELFSLGCFDKDVVCIVIDSHLKQRGTLTTGKYPDDLRSQYFYSEDFGFEPINVGDVITFDSSKEHAVMLHGRLDLISLWFEEDDTPTHLSY